VGTWIEALRRAEIVAVGAALARQGLIRGREGNISARLDDRWFLLTPTAADKRGLLAPDLLRCSQEGPLPSNASSEGLLHLETYRVLPAAGAVVHAHAPAVLALADRGELPDPRRLKEGEALVRAVAVVPALPPGSLELARTAAAALRANPVAVMQRHGLVAVGEDLWEALARVEVAELLARIALGDRRDDGAQ
jgi:ribulose-5-phosphate 4-epimerase/fuculose-1-phosphate aldolase